MAESELTTNKIWTEEERLSLAAKLDAELDDFINGLEKKRYAEGWPEDRWQEEMDKHPFFMKKAPQPGDEVHPMFEGLQKLKYDPEENTMEELALNYKEDGNFYMKHKKFRMAVYSYTEAIKVKCEKAEVRALLYNNRSAAHYFLKNYRTALNDAQRALEYNPDYAKARWRAAQCAYHLDKFELCTQICDEILENDINNNDAKELLKKNKNKKVEVERNKRKEDVEMKKRLTRFQRVCGILRSRNVKFDDIQKNKPITEELLRPKYLPLEDYPVHLDEDNVTLLWPTAFNYPEYSYSDFEQKLSENVVMEDCLYTLFEEPLPVDKTNTYRPDNLSVYYINIKVGSVCKVDLKKSIKDIINEKGFFVTGGALLFYIVPTASAVEKEFIRSYTKQKSISN